MTPAATVLTAPDISAPSLAPRPGNPAPLTEAERAACAAILALLLPHRRTVDTDPPPDTSAGLLDAFPDQVRQLAPFVTAGEPVLFTLPGFPCKSPNPAKVLGHLPDEGERLSLRFLDRLCSRIATVYAPGARVLICSDGHLFGDLIHVPDAHIDAYSDGLQAMIRAEGLRHLDIFDLRTVYGDLPYDSKRARVHDTYAPTVDELRERTRNDEQMLRLYRGITRFLVEDTAEFTGTRSALQRECRRRAYGVIQRSRAWGALIADHRPRSFRLSIHPQPRRTDKFGIRLLDARDVWTTPWHSCVLHHSDGRWELMHRRKAEMVGRLVLRGGRPSHFEAEAAGSS
ncbi:L-tyrosine/L-tryptophan isonitrile synthase family protein [Streptomyces sp. NPDC048639]|uniref:L-tyrosine/L-tryptophan isonitrile synthase family protein n=1 Tax=Streptomyces sp. NPDC048639 TaxID=3365581 RepID=UPI003711202A